MPEKREKRMAGPVCYNDKDNSAIISVKTSLYPLDVIYTAAYVFLDKAYVSLDGDPSGCVEVAIMPKAKERADLMARKFLNELLFYSHYKKILEQNKEVRNMILQRALITEVGLPAGDAKGKETTPEKQEEDIFDDLEDDFLDDPEGIAIPWEEKYGNLEKESADKGKK